MLFWSVYDSIWLQNDSDEITENIYPLWIMRVRTLASPVIFLFVITAIQVYLKENGAWKVQYAWNVRF
ncbi:hypothetical protein ccbrp13_36820 [Ktedonobacteria bacterium brp13]|nr:hypothetical protein ccbrp13_36820 [Ktedonobacteria bacterium brp13]